MLISLVLLIIKLKTMKLQLVNFSLVSSCLGGSLPSFYRSGQCTAVYNSTCEFACSAGYEGAIEIGICGVSGWTGVMAACNPVTCPSAVMNSTTGVIAACVNTTYNNTCEFTCISDRHLVSIFQCGADGIWVGDLACPLLPSSTRSLAPSLAPSVSPVSSSEGTSQTLIIIIVVVVSGVAVSVAVAFAIITRHRRLRHRHQLEEQITTVASLRDRVQQQLKTINESMQAAFVELILISCPPCASLVDCISH
jgi:hypothetical protein